MGQGISAPVTPAAVAPQAAATATPSSSALSDKQIQAMAMALGNLGKRPKIVGMGQPSMSGMPQTQTMQGGSFISQYK